MVDELSEIKQLLTVSFNIIKFICNYVEIYYGVSCPKLAEAYDVTSDGGKGWISIESHNDWSDNP